MSFRLAEAVEVLERTPAALEHLLQGLSPAWTRENEGPDTWSVRDVLGHLIHGEDTDWIPRARIILDQGEGRPFDPFDRFAQFSRFPDWPVPRLIARFAEARAENLVILRNWDLTPAQLSLRGRHPELGVVTMSELLATWAIHDLNHVAQIARVMAKRYAVESGPWRAYLPILGR
jgi:hypothetical protein